MNNPTEPVPGQGSGTATSSGVYTPRRLNTANAATQNPQAGTRFISSCNRCRRRKIKCDAGIPSCNSCEDSRTTCEYHDATSDTDMPRARIIGLEQHLQHLLAQHAQIDPQAAQNFHNVTVDGTLQPEFRGRLVVSGIRLACTFCRKRKIKCDGTAPCAGCTKFGRPTECSILYEEASSQGRSYISYLEDRINKLDRQLNTVLTEPRFTSHHQPQYGATPSQADHVAHGHAMQGSSLQHATDPNSEADVEAEEQVRSLRHESQEKINSVLQEIRQLNENSPAVLTNHNMHTPWNFRVSLLSLSGFRDETGPYDHPLSQAVIMPLVQHYISEIHPIMPILRLPDLQNSLSQFHTAQASAREKFTVLMVMANAASHMAEHATSMSNWNALKLFSTASYQANYDPNTLEGLELGLLVVLFAVLNPSFLNAWYLSGIAVRACSSLGLHRKLEDPQSEQWQGETPDLTAFTNLTELRQRLFWTTYTFDRLLSIGTGRPSGIDESSITLDTPVWLKTRSQESKRSRVDLELLRLQSEIYSTLYQDKRETALTDVEQAGIILSFETRLAEWTPANSSREQHNVMVRVMVNECYVLLYQPCPLITVRSEADVTKLSRYSIALIDMVYEVVFGQQKIPMSHFSIFPIYTAGLALMHVHSLEHLHVTKIDSKLRSAVYLSLSKTNSTLFRLADRWQVGLDLAEKFSASQTSFVEWSHGLRLREQLATEITALAELRVGALSKNSGRDTPDIKQVMHKLLSESEAKLGDSEAQRAATDTTALPSAQTQSASRANSSSTGPPTSRAQSTRQVEDQQPFDSSRPFGSVQPAPYSQMSPYNTSGATSQVAYGYPVYSREQFPVSHHGGPPSSNPAGPSHLPHRPTLQDPLTMTPLQQLAATAADHPGQHTHDSTKGQGQGPPPQNRYQH